ncbi:hypothetical protein BLX88_00190, partial [Bacillus obstructivus]
MWRLLPALIREMGQAYPELIRAESLISETLKLEETRFRKTLDRGLGLLSDATEGLGEGDRLDGETAFKLLNGEITLKRQYIIRQGQMKGMFDTGLTIGDTLLQHALGNNANTKMQSIVATIQKEQNKIIRNERSNLLIVQGVAGSGKTSAALQRVAYLMYRFREELNANDLLLLSPNPL